ncbi:MAG: arginine--tRNA ligase [Deltaproteobacteria bacterium]|jgi:arginyl-tRNA synthetase|nr:arginine--tRNA ligase [Deltaproteobacteria bacterium]
MKDKIKGLVWQGAQAAAAKAGLSQALDQGRFLVERPANPEFGDFSSNAALVFSKDFKAADPKATGRNLAQLIIDGIPDKEGVFASVGIAGPGFINFRLTAATWQRQLKAIRASGATYGSSAPSGRKVLLEFVSSNPTGPLHVGHGRGAAWGDAMANVLSFLGDEVTREYYINDAGNQIATLGRSVLFRLENPEPDREAPDGLYKGLYVLGLADELKRRHDPAWFARPEGELLPDLSREASDIILQSMREDLGLFNVGFDNWFSERSLYESGEVGKAIGILKERGHTYEGDGALYFKSTDYGDDKDRVLVKSDGDTTYFASDVAYHENKFGRGYDLAIDVLGADHAGYLARMSAAVQALGHDKDQLRIVLYQLVKLFRDKAPVRMSTRAGEFVPLRLVLDEVSPDAARFLYLTQSHDSTLDFDLEVAKAKNSDNPAYYVQYLTARIFQVRAKALSAFGAIEEPDFSLLKDGEEIALISQLEGFPELLRNIGRNLQPHLLTTWLVETAKLFHHYYGGHRIVQEGERDLSFARLGLAWTVRTVVGIGLRLLGAEAPERM